jgi:hypothetical protein
MIGAIIKLTIGVALILLAVVLGPLIGIWSLNTLFPALSIPYTWETWAAFFFLFGSLTGLIWGSKRG